MYVKTINGIAKHRELEDCKHTHSHHDTYHKRQKYNRKQEVLEGMSGTEDQEVVIKSLEYF